MKLKLLMVILITALCSISSGLSVAEDTNSTTGDQASPEPTPVPTYTPVPQPTETPLPQAPLPSTKSVRPQTNVKALIIHKPMPSPSWGKVIQYHRDQIFALTDKNREILHEFLFQDDDGIIRTAIFHESGDGNGYWEVWVWDQQ